MDLFDKSINTRIQIEKNLDLWSCSSFRSFDNLSKYIPMWNFQNSYLNTLATLLLFDRYSKLIFTSNDLVNNPMDICYFVGSTTRDKLVATMVEQVARGRINRYQATQRLIQCNILNPWGNSALMFSPRRSACPWDSVIASKSPSDPRQRLTINETRAKCVPSYGVICAFLNRRNSYLEWPPTERPIYLSSSPRSRPRSSSKKEKKKRKEEDSLIGDLSEGLRCRDFFEGSVIRAGITGRLAMGSSTLQMQPLPDSNISREKYNLNTVLRFSRGYFQVFNEVARLTFVYLVKSSKLSLSLL